MAKCRLGKVSEASSWLAEIKNHEHEKRRFVHEGLLKAPTVRMDQGSISRAERMFDPLLQRFRDQDVEAKQRALEDYHLTAHLNRARDVSIMRDGNTHIISMESRTATLEKRRQSNTQTSADVNTMSMPSTMVDYNILSNLPMEQHHFAKPEDRPRCAQRSPRARKVQACQLRDFNIVSNRYMSEHEAKAGRDEMLNNLEVTHKYREQCRFDPVMQKFNEADVEERFRCCDDAREVEVCMRQAAVLPSCEVERVSAHYDVITHQADNDGALKLQQHDSREHQRKARYKARHVDEHKNKMKSIVYEDTSANQRLGCCAHERWEETTSRGFNIVNNKAYGNGPKFEKLHEPFSTPRLTTWEMVEQDRSGSTPPPSSGYLGGTIRVDAPSKEALRSAREPVPQQVPGTTPRGGSVSGTTPRGGSVSGTPRARATPRTLSDAGSAALSSKRGRPPLLAMSGKEVSAPPPPPIPGSPVGSVYSKPKM